MSIATPKLMPDAIEPPLAAAKPGRLYSLDIFRGITIAMMLLVNNPGHGDVYTPLDHAPWNGWTPTDLVFPFFVFIMGVAVPFSMAKRAATDSKGMLFLHVLVRSISLFLLGELCYSIPGVPHIAPVPILRIVRIAAVVFLAIALLLMLYPWRSRIAPLIVPPIVAATYLAILFGIHFFNRHLLDVGAVPTDYSFGTGIFNPDHLRIPGILQRIGICYLFAGSLFLITDWRGIAIAGIFFLSVYSILMLGVSYPSLTEHGQTVRGRLERQDNFARYVDVNVFGAHNYRSYPDPEGLVSTLPAIGTGLIGLLVGIWLRTPRPAANRCVGVFAFGVIAVLVGQMLNYILIPINKQIWTPSYVIFVAGLSMLGLGTLFYICDILQIRKPFLPLVWYGMNAITAFVLAGVVARLLGIIPSPTNAKLGEFLADHAAHFGQQITIGSPQSNGALAFSLGFVLFFGVIMGVLYRFKIFLKV